MHITKCYVSVLIPEINKLYLIYRTAKYCVRILIFGSEINVEKFVLVLLNYIKSLGDLTYFYDPDIRF